MAQISSPAFWLQWLSRGLPLLAALLAAWSVNLGSVQNLEHVVQDGITRLTPAAPLPQDITIIDIDESSLAQLGPWPWSRSVVASLMQAIRQQGARAQIWDMVLPESQASDAALQAQLRPVDPSASTVVLGQILVMDPSVQNLPETGRLWADNATGLPCSQHSPVVGFIGNAASLQPGYVGHISATPGLDGILRQLPAVICHQGKAYPQLVLSALAALYPDSPWQYNTQHSIWTGVHTLQRGPATLQLSPTGQLHVPYAQPHTTWSAISAYQLLDGSLPLNSLRQQTVLVGSTALGLADTISTPYHSTAPGISVHAELLAAAHSGRWYLPWLAAPWLALIITLCTGWLWRTDARSSRWSSLGSLSWVPFVWPWLFIVSLAWLGRYLGHPLPVVAPVLAMLFLMAAHMLLRLEEQRQDTQRMVQHLQSFLPRELADQVAHQHPNSDSLGKPCQGTLMAVQIGGLSRWSAQVDSLQALGLMHGITSAVEAASAEFGGRLEHLEGQTLWVSWSAERQGDDAIAAAHAISTRLAAVLERNEIERNLLSVRCAIETGAYLHGIVGVAGSRHTVLLGPVTERLHGMLSLIDELACPILVGSSAAAGLAPGHHPYQLHTIGQFLLPDTRHSITLSRASWTLTA